MGPWDGSGPEYTTGQCVKLLEVLWADWEHLYLIGYTDEHGWWASRRGVIGHLVTADGPDELGKVIRDDYGLA